MSHILFSVHHLFLSPLQIIFSQWQSPGDEANQHVIPDDRVPIMYLLYRPGHYDILYRKAWVESVGSSRAMQLILPINALLSLFLCHFGVTLSGASVVVFYKKDSQLSYCYA
jgi:hypothetical protein